MSEKIVEFNVEIIRGQIKELVRGSVEETQNELLEKEMELLAQAVCCECSEIHQSYRSGRYDWLLHHNLRRRHAPQLRLRDVSFKTAITRYCSQW